MNTATSQFDGHTPGPWTAVTGQGAHHRDMYVRHGQKQPDGSWPAVAKCCSSCIGARVVVEANARLIAAAPELLRQRDALAAALRSLRAEVKEYLEGDDLAAGAESVAAEVEARKRAMDRFTVSMILARAALASIENGA